jgi:hypothetical protein
VPECQLDMSELFVDVIDVNSKFLQPFIIGEEYNFESENFNALPANILSILREYGELWPEDEPSDYDSLKHRITSRVKEEGHVNFEMGLDTLTLITLFSHFHARKDDYVIYSPAVMWFCSYIMMLYNEKPIDQFYTSFLGSSVQLADSNFHIRVSMLLNLMVDDLSFPGVPCELKDRLVDEWLRYAFTFPSLKGNEYTGMVEALIPALFCCWNISSTIPQWVFNDESLNLSTGPWVHSDVDFEVYKEDLKESFQWLYDQELFYHFSVYAFLIFGDHGIDSFLPGIDAGNVVSGSLSGMYPMDITHNVLQLVQFIRRFRFCGGYTKSYRSAAVIRQYFSNAKKTLRAYGATEDQVISIEDSGVFLNGRLPYSLIPDVLGFDNPLNWDVKIFNKLVTTIENFFESILPDLRTKDRLKDNFLTFATSRGSGMTVQVSGEYHMKLSNKREVMMYLGSDILSFTPENVGFDIFDTRINNKSINYNYKAGNVSRNRYSVSFSSLVTYPTTGTRATANFKQVRTVIVDPIPRYLGQQILVYGLKKFMKDLPHSEPIASDICWMHRFSLRASSSILWLIFEFDASKWDGSWREIYRKAVAKASRKFDHVKYDENVFVGEVLRNLFMSYLNQKINFKDTDGKLKHVYLSCISSGEGLTKIFNDILNICLQQVARESSIHPDDTYVNGSFRVTGDDSETEVHIVRPETAERRINYMKNFIRVGESFGLEYGNSGSAYIGCADYLQVYTNRGYILQRPITSILSRENPIRVTDPINDMIGVKATIATLSERGYSMQRMDILFKLICMFRLGYDYKPYDGPKVRIRPSVCIMFLSMSRGGVGYGTWRVPLPNTDILFEAAYPSVSRSDFKRYHIAQRFSEIKNDENFIRKHYHDIISSPVVGTKNIPFEIFNPVEVMNDLLVVSERIDAANEVYVENIPKSFDYRYRVENNIVEALKNNALVNKFQRNRRNDFISTSLSKLNYNVKMAAKFRYLPSYKRLRWAWTKVPFQYNGNNPYLGCDDATRYALNIFGVRGGPLMKDYNLEEIKHILYSDKDFPREYDIENYVYTILKNNHNRSLLSLENFVVKSGGSRTIVEGFYRALETLDPLTLELNYDSYSFAGGLFRSLNITRRFSSRLVDVTKVSDRIVNYEALAFMISIYMRSPMRIEFSPDHLI